MDDDKIATLDRLINTATELQNENQRLREVLEYVAHVCAGMLRASREGHTQRHTGIPVPRGPMDFPTHSRHTRVSGSTGEPSWLWNIPEKPKG